MPISTEKYAGLFIISLKEQAKPYSLKVISVVSIPFLFLDKSIWKTLLFPLNPFSESEGFNMAYYTVEPFKKF